MRLSARLVAPLTLTVIALLSWLPLSTPAGEAPVAAGAAHYYDQGRLEDRQGLRVLRLSGAPYAMGYQHGVLLAEEIRSGLREQIYDGLILEGGIRHSLLLRHARSMDSQIPSEYQEELRGLADGASVSYSEVLLLHSFRDLLSQPWPRLATRDLLLTLSPQYRPQLAAVNTSSFAGSRTGKSSGGHRVSIPLEAVFAAFGRATRDGNLLQGIDFAPTQLGLEDLVLIVYDPQVGNRFVTVAWPGAVGVSIGLSEEKISVAELASPSQDASLDGIPVSFLLRDVLQYAGDIPSALRVLSSAGRTGGHNVIVGDGKPADAQALELSAHLYAVFEAEDDLITRCNHYLDPALSETQHISSPKEYAASQARLEATGEGLHAAYGRLDLPDAIAMVGCGEATVAEGQGDVSGVVIASSDLQVCVCSAGKGAPRCFSLDEDR